MRVGEGSHTYERVESWAKIPEQWTLGWVGSVATDRQGRVYCFCRGTHPLVVFDRDGKVVGHWGDDLLNHAHGVFMDAEQRLWLTDRELDGLVVDVTTVLARYLDFKKTPNRKPRLLSTILMPEPMSADD